MLYIVSTPIGNLQDITIRAIKMLFYVDYILTENVQKTKLLLSELKKRYPNLIKIDKNPKVLLFNEFIENENIYEYFLLLQNNNVALTSSAGTPLISDPGYKLVKLAISKNLNVIPIPGVCAGITSLTVSAMPTDKFLFIGFLPRSQGKKEKILADLKEIFFKSEKHNINPTIIIYESPHRIIETLSLIEKLYGNIQIAVTREITKKFEEVMRDSISNMIEKFEKQEPKGEFTILFNLKF